LKRIHTSRLTLCLFLLVPVLPAASAQTDGSSPFSPVPKGLALGTIIECGEGYLSHELYDARITLEEVLRGEEAWSRIRAADPANRPAAPGSEYVLARVRFEYSARGLPGNCVLPLAPENFTAYSAGGETYDPVKLAPPDPALRKNLKSGEAFEGWLVFMVSASDRAPLLYYSADEGGGTNHGGGKWFALR
jgi:hypothetical protein